MTPNELDTKLLVAKVETALLGGVKLLLYRNKAAGKPLLFRQATALLAACRAYDALLIINDHLDLCAQIDADGIHLGQADCRPGPVRRLLGADKMIGVTCYKQIRLAQEAEAEGANYVVLGANFSAEATSNQTGALNLFHQAKQILNIPVVGYGDMTIDQASQIKAAGADAIAIMSPLFDAKDISKFCQQFNALYH